MVQDLAELGASGSELDRREILCREIALAAGALALDGFAKRRIAGFGLKGPQDFLTETDSKVERHLRARIAEAFPDDGFLGEETGGVAAPSVWVVDPIDGTANFARGIPHYCISIAFVCNDEIEFGAIYDPNFDELFFARKGRGATRNGAPMKVAGTSDFNAACVEFGWSSRVSNGAYLAALSGILDKGANVRRGASGALGLAYVADGRSDAYAELHMHAWDCLAGLLLVKEAGGIVAPFLELGGLTGGGAVLAVAPGVARGISEATGIALQRETAPAA